MEDHQDRLLLDCLDRKAKTVPSASEAKYPPLQRPSRRFALYVARKVRAALTEASAAGGALT